mmetsp:Transcript_4676/g.5788  ORF Transcript_4676/g.5788 Transcript_4676/m.5788 type:complete len:178 (+) Transcript_4676:74-607(+)
MSLKIAVVGNEGVGKCSLLSSVDGPSGIRRKKAWYVYPSEDNTGYIGLCLLPSEPEDRERRQNLMRHFFMDCVLICFSPEDSQSFRDVTEVWLLEINEISPNVPVIVVCCKKDLRWERGSRDQNHNLIAEDVASELVGFSIGPTRIVDYVEYSSLGEDSFYKVIIRTVRKHIKRLES